jgi:predicted O-methyltransferase YrrM
MGICTTRNDANVWDWLRIFAEQNISEQELRILEIGSWEGRSTCFLFSIFPSALITAVDTWGGSDEHTTIDTKSVENRFDANVSIFSSRLTQFKGSSEQFFQNFNYRNYFDLILVDGSHFADDVFIDGVRSFMSLKDGGLLIFDDYLWRFYEEIQANPITAIKLFVTS